MASKVTEYALMLFFAFVSMVVLYLIYLGLINSQKMVQNQVNEEEYKSECNCFQVAGLTDKEIVIRNVMCDYVSYLTISWPDYEIFYNETIFKGDVIILPHNSTHKEEYILYYNDCK
ncbi:MAG: hypothetical protein WC376_00190 [Candidatus Nanoarchaeia archaeon]|jgi:hypothetical protein